MEDNNAMLLEQAQECLSGLFYDLLGKQDVTFESFEQDVLNLGHSVMARAMSKALEQFDSKLCSNKPNNLHVHDIRQRTLASMLGDLHFIYRRLRDEYGNTRVLFAEALDLGWGVRVTPAAVSYLENAGACVSFAQAAELLVQAGGSAVSDTTVMNAIHTAGRLCKAEDEQAAIDLYRDGVVPDAEGQTDVLCVEADGTWINLQNVSEDEPKRVEIKAFVAYAGKDSQDAKTARIQPIRHGCVGTPDEFWTQAVAAMAKRFDLSKLKTCHLGTDGESWCKSGGSYIPCATEGHLDPFHVNRAILSCFSTDNKAIAKRILRVLAQGETDNVIALMRACRALGLTKKGADKVIKYLENNKELIAKAGPSLGTMEAENQHVYGARMDSVPCGWSREGASAMARIRSRRASNIALPRRTRDQSITRKRRRAQEKRIETYLLHKVDTKVPTSVGSGYEYPHQANTDQLSAQIHYTAGVDTGMIAING